MKQGSTYLISLMFLNIVEMAMKLVMQATNTALSASKQFILILSRVETNNAQAAKQIKPEIKAFQVCFAFCELSSHHFIKKLTKNIMKSEYIKPTLKTIVLGYSNAEVMILGFYLSQVAHQVSQKSTQQQIAPKDNKVEVQIMRVTFIAPIDSYSCMRLNNYQLFIVKAQQQYKLLKSGICQIISFLKQMGNTCQSDLSVAQESSIFNPIQLDFKRVQSVIIPPSLNQIMNSIKQIAEFPDPRQNAGLKWYHSLKYGLYMFGDLKDKKPIGECLFYLKTMSPQTDLPVIISTKIEQKNLYSPNTLLIYMDRTYYLGSIISNGIEPPIADGRGLLVNKHFIYQGQFSNGYPNGFGTYKTKGGILVGQFSKGAPSGKCIERSKKGLFIGELFSKFRKTGKLITPTNQMEYINEQFNTSGITMVQL